MRYRGVLRSKWMTREFHDNVIDKSTSKEGSTLKKSLFAVSVATLLAAANFSVTAQENLVYVPVDPCRIVDTRKTGGDLTDGEERDFKVSGNVATQGGDAGGCPDPKDGTGVEPLAVSAYVVAVPASGSSQGNLSAYPSDAPLTTEGAVVINFPAGQVLGNTTTIGLCDPATCPPSGEEFTILVQKSNQHVVIDIQGYFYPITGNCPDDMVTSGSICVDQYEASVWDTAAGDGTQYGAGTDDYPCSNDGSDCGDGALNPIYAVSRSGEEPSVEITWYQAAQACANVDKRLPTTAEWQMAASGTPSGLTPDPALGCNTNSGAVIETGTAGALCQSTAGAYDMVGNVFELVAEMDTDFVAPGPLVSFVGSDSLNTRAFGADYLNSGNLAADTESTLILDGPLITAASVGFRCVR